MTVGLLSFVRALASGLSLRNVLNMNNFSFGLDEYAFIDHTKTASGWLSSFGANWATTTDTWPSVLDANGWPQPTTFHTCGGGINVPDPANFNGPYTIDWTGNGVVDLSLSTATWTATSLVNCTVTFNSGGTLQLTSTGGASLASAQISYTISSGSGPQTITCLIDGGGTSGFFVKNLRFYRTADATDLAAGKIFRSAWKQPIVNLCPSAIRWMNNLGPNNSRQTRFENRTLPGNAGYLQQCNWVSSPSYSSNVTGTNQYTVAAATPTTGNPKNTPVSMVHGEVATLRFTNGIARATSSLVISAITNANPGQVTTSTAHGFSTGDVIGHYLNTITNTGGTLNSNTIVTNINNASIATGMFVFGPGIQAGTTVTGINSGLNQITLSLAATISGNVGLAFRCMKNLHQRQCTITVIDATHYTIGIDTTSLGTFSAVGTNNAYQFITLQVGSGSDRTAYPVVFGDGNTPVSIFGAYISTNDYKTFNFDKTVSAQNDSSGNPVLGVWIMSAISGAPNLGYEGDFPIEVCVALINELNAMSPAHTIGMWVNLPTYSLCSMDPDYTTASDFAVNMFDVIMNPSSSVRANGYSALGYSGLTQLNQPTVICEYNNELWNGSGNDGRGYLTNRSIIRWGTSVLPYSDFQDMKALRSTLMARAVKASNPPGLSRIKFVLGMWGTFGLPLSGDGAGNFATTFGGNVTANPIAVGDWYTNDTLVTTGSWGRPIDNHDGVAPATYFDPPDSYYSTSTGTGTFTDDSAMYNGLNNTGNGGGNYSGAANPTQAITNFVSKVVDAGNTGGGQSIYLYQNVLMPQYASTLASLAPGKIVVNYEGGTDWQCEVNKNQAGHVLTAGDSLFSTAVNNSSQWATAQVNFFNSVNGISGCFMPSIYIAIFPRWAYCNPDTYATIGGVPTEGAALTVNSPPWIAMGNRNQGLPS